MAMMDVYNIQGERVSEINLPADIFEVAVKNHILHEVVVMQLANRRSGTASTKERSDVRGGGRKPYRQKGTGRARAGTIRSPLMRGGGIVFGPSPRNFARKVSKKIRKQALKMALATKYEDDALIILDRLELGEIKTKRFVAVMKNLKTDNALIVTDTADEILERSSRNVPDVKVLRMEGLNVYDILRFRQLVLLESALKKIEERLLP